MKTFRKIASLVIAIAMMATVLVMPAQAAEIVFRNWDFDDNVVPTEFKVIPAGGVGDGRLVAKGRNVHGIQIGSKDEPIGFTIGEYPVIEMNWKYSLNTGAVVNETRRQMYVNLRDANGALIIQFQFEEDSDGVKVSNQYALHKYEFAKGVVAAKGTATTAEEASSKEIAYLTICPFNKVTEGLGIAEFNSIKIYNPGVSVDLTVSAKGVVYDCDSVTLTADVNGATPEKVEFFVNDKLAETDTEAPYSVNYNFTEEKAANKVYALATFSNGTTVKSSLNTDVQSMKSGRVDFDSYLPPYIQRSGAIVNNAGEFVYTGTPNAVNVGSSTYNFVKGGFDITKKKYFKMRAKLDGTARNDTYMIGFKVFSPKATTEYGTVYAKEDLNGNKFSKEYQQFVFDITECLTTGGEKIDFTGKTVGLIQMWPMRTVSTGTLTIDWIEISDDPTVVDENPITVKIASNVTVNYAGKEATITASLDGATPEKVEFYANGELFETVDKAPYVAKYALSGEKIHNITAKAIKGEKVFESNAVSIKSINEMRFDFNEYIPPNFETGKATPSLDGNGALKAEGANSTMMNFGRPERPLKEEGFDPTVYKYLKVRAKLEGTPKNDPYTLSLAIYDVNSTASYGTFTYKTDMNGKTFTEEYQELVFDLTNGINPDTGLPVDISGKRAGWLQIMPMRKTNPGVIYIDWIELTNKIDESEEAAAASAEIIGAAANETELKYVSKIAIENDPEIVAFGTTFIPLWLFEKSGTDVATVEYNNEDYNVQNGQTYGATLTDIPEEFKGMSIVGKSFIRTADGGYNWSPAVYSSVEDTTINTVE